METIRRLVFFNVSVIRSEALEEHVMSLVPDLYIYDAWLSLCSRNR